MQGLSLYRATVLAVALLLPVSVLAHHGWSWTTGGNIQLTGIIVETRPGNPHGEVVIDADYVREKLSELVQREDLSKFIL